MKEVMSLALLAYTDKRGKICIQPHHWQAQESHSDMEEWTVGLFNGVEKAGAVLSAFLEHKIVWGFLTGHCLLDA